MSLKELIPLLALVVTNLVAVAGIVYYMASTLGKRIDDLDKRIDSLDKRIDGLDKRIDDLGSNMNERFSDLNSNMNARFSEINANINAPGRRPPNPNEPRTRQPLPKNRRPHHESRNPSDPASLRTIPPTGGIGLSSNPRFPFISRTSLCSRQSTD